jgi:hypothetical protein
MSQPDPIPVCEACGWDVELVDNFCRKCGAQLVPPQLPVVIEPNRSLLVRQTVPPALVKTAAALAVGTAIEVAGRALVGALSRRAARASVAPPVPRSQPARRGFYSETIYIRRTRVHIE